MNRTGTKHPSFSGYKELPSSAIARIKHGAIRRNLKFDLSTKFLYELYIEQYRLCALSGLPIVFGNRIWRIDKAIECTASLDRIDSAKDYTANNVQWIHKTVNLMKNKLDQTYFINMCTNIAKQNCGWNRCS